jgi:hypothetical protein
MEFLVSGNFFALNLPWVTHLDHRWILFYKLYAGLVIIEFIGVIVVYPIATVT